MKPLSISSTFFVINSATTNTDILVFDDESAVGLSKKGMNPFPGVTITACDEDYRCSAGPAVFLARFNFNETCVMAVGLPRYRDINGDARVILYLDHVILSQSLRQSWAHLSKAKEKKLYTV